MAISGDDQWVLVKEERIAPYTFVLSGNYRHEGNPAARSVVSWEPVDGAADVKIRKAAC